MCRDEVEYCVNLKAKLVPKSMTLLYFPPAQGIDNYSVTVKKLIDREFVRIKEFGHLSLNPSETFKLISNINEKYNLNFIGEEEWK